MEKTREREEGVTNWGDDSSLNGGCFWSSSSPSSLLSPSSCPSYRTKWKNGSDRFDDRPPISFSFYPSPPCLDCQVRQIRLQELWFEKEAFRIANEKLQRQLFRQAEMVGQQHMILQLSRSPDRNPKTIYQVHHHQLNEEEEIQIENKKKWIPTSQPSIPYLEYPRFPSKTTLSNHLEVRDPHTPDGTIWGSSPSQQVRYGEPFTPSTPTSCPLLLLQQEGEEELLNHSTNIDQNKKTNALYSQIPWNHPILHYTNSISIQDRPILPSLTCWEEEISTSTPSLLPHSYTIDHAKVFDRYLYARYCCSSNSRICWNRFKGGVKDHQKYSSNPFHGTQWTALILAHSTHKDHTQHEPEQVIPIHTHLNMYNSKRCWSFSTSNLSTTPKWNPSIQKTISSSSPHTFPTTATTTTSMTKALLTTTQHMTTSSTRTNSFHSISKQNPPPSSSSSTTATNSAPIASSFFPNTLIDTSTTVVDRGPLMATSLHVSSSLCPESNSHIHTTSSSNTDLGGSSSPCFSYSVSPCNSSSSSSSSSLSCTHSFISPFPFNSAPFCCLSSCTASLVHSSHSLMTTALPSLPVASWLTKRVGRRTGIKKEGLKDTPNSAMIRNTSLVTSTGRTPRKGLTTNLKRYRKVYVRILCCKSCALSHKQRNENISSKSCLTTTGSNGVNITSSRISCTSISSTSSISSNTTTTATPPNPKSSFPLSSQIVSSSPSSSFLFSTSSSPSSVGSASGNEYCSSALQLITSLELFGASTPLAPRKFLPTACTPRYPLCPTANDPLTPRFGTALS